MAGIAGSGGFILPVTGDAVPHVQSSGLVDSFHTFHWPMTGLALNAFEHVGLVAEIYKVRHIVYSNPLEGMTGFIFLPQLDNMCFAGSYDIMAPHADIHGRHRGMRRSLGIGVTVQAGNFIVARVNFMAEGNRLNRGKTEVIISLGREPP